MIKIWYIPHSPPQRFPHPSMAELKQWRHHDHITATNAQQETAPCHRK